MSKMYLILELAPIYNRFFVISRTVSLSSFVCDVYILCTFTNHRTAEKAVAFSSFLSFTLTRSETLNSQVVDCCRKVFLLLAVSGTIGCKNRWTHHVNPWLITQAFSVMSCEANLKPLTSKFQKIMDEVVKNKPVSVLVFS